jgi:hypothetical protein
VVTPGKSRDVSEINEHYSQWVMQIRMDICVHLSTAVFGSVLNYSDIALSFKMLVQKTDTLSRFHPY